MFEKLLSANRSEIACRVAAHRYFLTAERFDATEALLNASPNAVKACKTLLHEVAGKDIDADLIAHTVASIANIRASDEGREGVSSFLQKRKPSWLAGEGA